MRAYANRLREQRERLGMTRRELAQGSDLNEAMIAELEDGVFDIGKLKLGEAAAIANALGVTIDDVFTREISDDTGERLAYRIFTSGRVLIPLAAVSKPAEGITREYSGELICADENCYETLDKALEALDKLRSHIGEPMTLWNKSRQVCEVKEYFIEGVYIDCFDNELRTDGNRIYAKFK